MILKDIRGLLVCLNLTYESFSVTVTHRTSDIESFRTHYRTFCFRFFEKAREIRIENNWR